MWRSLFIWFQVFSQSVISQTNMACKAGNAETIEYREAMRRMKAIASRGRIVFMVSQPTTRVVAATMAAKVNVRIGKTP